MKRKNSTVSALSKTEDVKANTSNVDANKKQQNQQPKMPDKNNLMQEPKY
jgi:hypothetical protein